MDSEHTEIPQNDPSATSDEQGHQVEIPAPEDLIPKPARPSLRRELHHNRGIGWTSTSHEESRKRRKMARASRKKNRRK